MDDLQNQASVEAPTGSCGLRWDAEPAGLTEVARRRRDEVMDAAESIIAGQGIDQLSLARIEERAGMSRGQLTYYFPTKESILLAVHERMLRRMMREFTESDGPKPMTGRAWDCFQHFLGIHLGLNSAPDRPGTGIVQPALYLPRANGTSRGLPGPSVGNGADAAEPDRGRYCPERSRAAPGRAPRSLRPWSRDSCTDSTCNS